MQKIAKNSLFVHHRTTLSGCIFTTQTYIDNQKKNSLNSNISCTCPHNMVDFGPLMAEIGAGVWGTPANFNGFRVLALCYCTVVAQRRSTKLHDVWSSPELVHYTVSQ